MHFQQNSMQLMWFAFPKKHNFHSLLSHALTAETLYTYRREPALTCSFLFYAHIQFLETKEFVVLLKFYPSIIVIDLYF